jgi:hypothetical protein
VPNDSITLAGGLFETWPVDDVYFASSVSNEAGGLERPRNQRNCGSPCSKHLRDKILRESYGGSLGPEADGLGALQFGLCALAVMSRKRGS